MWSRHKEEMKELMMSSYEEDMRVVDQLGSELKDLW